MKTILLGNAGAGKSTLTRALLANEDAAVLSLDEIAFEGKTANRRPIESSVASVQAFIDSNVSWVIEGCYADILEPILSNCDQLIFLNPGVEACVAHCNSRPFEPSKFESAEAQNANLQNLIDWVRRYESRQDEYGLARHRSLFDGFSGDKREFTNPADYAAGATP